MTRHEANERMIAEQIAARGLDDPHLLAAFRSVPREAFVPPSLRGEAYSDTPLPLEHGQTISQPFIVALMTWRLRLTGDERILEIGTGSGYQTAILARLCRWVYSAELEPELAATVRTRLNAVGITNVTLRVGDGLEVFRDEAPFHAILSAAAPEEIPQALTDQLADGGRAILPVGGASQYLWLVTRSGERVAKEQLEPVRFVPMRRYCGI